MSREKGSRWHYLIKKSEQFGEVVRIPKDKPQVSRRRESLDALTPLLPFLEYID